MALQGNEYAEDFFVYEIDFAGVASNGQANGAIQIQADSDFKWLRASYYVTIANAAFNVSTQPVPSMTVQIVDGGSGRQLMQNPVPIPSIFGDGKLPFVLPIPKVFRARSSINIAVANFDAAVTYNLRLSFIGVKVFKYG